MSNRLIWGYVALTALVITFSLFFLKGGMATETETGFGETGFGIICNTEEQITKFVAEYTGDTDESLRKVNVTEAVCGVLGAAFYRGKTVATIATPGGVVEVVEILLIAINDGISWIPTPPTKQFTLFAIKGRDI